MDDNNLNPTTKSEISDKAKQAREAVAHLPSVDEKLNQLGDAVGGTTKKIEGAVDGLENGVDKAIDKLDSFLNKLF